MVEALRSLVELSRIDGEIATREEEKATLPEARAVCARRRADADAKVQAARSAIEALELTQRQHESQARDQQALLDKLEGQQHQVKSNDAYTALLHEMETAKEAISEAETAVLEDMEALDEGKAAVDAAESHLADETEATREEEAGIDAREQVLDSEIAGFRSEREGIAGGLDAKVRSTYERVAGRRRPPVAIVNGETCTGCRVGIPPQNFIEVRMAESLVSCGQCNRILVHEAHLG